MGLRQSESARSMEMRAESELEIPETHGRFIVFILFGLQDRSNVEIEVNSDGGRIGFLRSRR